MLMIMMTMMAVVAAIYLNHVPAEVPHVFPPPPLTGSGVIDPQTYFTSREEFHEPGSE